MMLGDEEFYTLVDENNCPVYTHQGMDGHFSQAHTLGDMLTFTKKIGWSQMMYICRQSHALAARDPKRIKVFPAKVTMELKKIMIE